MSSFRLAVAALVRRALSATRPLTATTHYWVRVSTRCGTVQSLPMTVTVVQAAKRRSARP